eukprot:843068-Alexandrium_andersonii.AAC.1
MRFRDEPSNRRRSRLAEYRGRAFSIVAGRAAVHDAPPESEIERGVLPGFASGGRRDGVRGLATDRAAGEW